MSDKKQAHAGGHHHGALGKHLLKVALAFAQGAGTASGTLAMEAVLHEPPPEPAAVVEAAPAAPPLLSPSPETLAGATPPLTPHVVTFRNARGEEFEETVEMPYYKATDWAAHAGRAARPDDKQAVEFDIYTPHQTDVPLQAFVDRNLLLKSVPEQITLTGEQQNVLQDLVQVKVKPLPRF